MLRLDEPLPWHVLDLASPVLPEDLPGLPWMTCLPHDPIRAMHEFVAGVTVRIRHAQGPCNPSTEVTV
ncbi:hypothetical protein [Dactylosporangium darangshiense]|uniref:hypothetical protein n=1 Tax=Dactylosporangium darangshiense TaxID=579108 RepID=UPI003632F9DC